jgi:hypothetical protein
VLFGQSDTLTVICFPDMKPIRIKIALEGANPGVTVGVDADGRISLNYLRDLIKGLVTIGVRNPDSNFLDW